MCDKCGSKYGHQPRCPDLFGKEQAPVCCPECGTTDYDTNEDGTEGFCIVGCGAWFDIKNRKATIKGVISPGAGTI